MTDHQSLRWELLGTVFIVVAGSALHFTFAWTWYWLPAALVAAVNESVWEHLKLAFWPGLLWSLLGYGIFRPHFLDFWSAKGYGLLIAPILIVVIFYSYTTVLGRNVLALDIATFAIAIVVGQIATAKLLEVKIQSALTRALGLGLLLGQLAAYSTFTFYPPPFALFVDSRNGTTGIPSQQRVTKPHHRKID